jgi:predicted DNA-binding transcriptional regulator AlpA
MKPVRTADEINQAELHGITAAQIGRSESLVLTRSQAAAMCGISVHTFDQWVQKGILPPAIRKTRRWSRVAVERALAAQAHAPPADNHSSPFEEWKRNHAH